ncbi:MAG: serine--tRNA ligase [Cytophagia bacterium]|nr:MAG: serine--tRNA ligase [Cytophagia bacterium]TAG46490.1 MAG: serine--tRNA ligase [Cytophagia bacterium]
MLSLNLLREQTDKVIEGLKKRHFTNAEILVREIIAIDQRRREYQLELDNTNAEMNKLSKSIGELMKNNQKIEAEQAKTTTTDLKIKSKDLEIKLKEAESTLYEMQVKLPNVPFEKVKAGKTPEDNEIIKTPESLPQLHENAVPHWELIKQYDIIDFELGIKITGAGFPVYKGKGAKLQRALINFFLDEAEKAGYKEIQSPILINKESGFGTGQLPDKDGQMYFANEDELYLIPTAEVPITNLYRDVIIEEKDLPIKNVGYTPCFRREAGSWGAHVRGLNRLHQFDKVEIVQIAHPQQSYQILEQMSQYVQGLLEKLELPYRVLRLCGGDMGFTSAMTYDMEVYSAAQKRWLEVSSVSNFEAFQANRLQLRYRDADKKNHTAHTLNGSALALPRIVASILENNQTPEGIKIPKILVPYTKFDMI